VTTFLIVVTEVTTVKLKELELDLAITFYWLDDCAVLLHM